MSFPLNQNQRMLLVCAIPPRRKFVDDQWMACEGLLEMEAPPHAAWWWTQPVSILSLQSAITVREHVSTACLYMWSWVRLYTHIFMAGDLW